MKKWDFSLCVAAVVLAVLQTICIILRLTYSLQNNLLIFFDDTLTVLLPLLWVIGFITILIMFNKDSKSTKEEDKNQVKNAVIWLLVLSFAVLAADAVQLVLSFGFNISNAILNLLVHGANYILMCIYSVFFLRRAYKEYAR